MTNKKFNDRIMKRFINQNESFLLLLSSNKNFSCEIKEYWSEKKQLSIVSNKIKAFHEQWKCDFSTKSVSVKMMTYVQIVIDLIIDANFNWFSDHFLFKQSLSIYVNLINFIVINEYNQICVLLQSAFFFSAFSLFFWFVWGWN